MLFNGTEGQKRQVFLTSSLYILQYEGFTPSIQLRFSLSQMVHKEVLQIRPVCNTYSFAFPGLALGLALEGCAAATRHYLGSRLK